MNDMEPYKRNALNELLLYTGERAWPMIKLWLGYMLVTGFGVYSGVLSMSQAAAFTSYLVMILGAVLIIGVIGEWTSWALESWKRD